MRMHIRCILLAMFAVVGLSSFARTILVPTQPVSPYDDTEVVRV